MRILIHRLITRDPTTFVGTFAAWAVACGLGLVFTDDTFSRSPVWDGLRMINHDDTLWGYILLVDGFLLLLCIRAGTLAMRAAVTLFSAVLWFAIGLSLTYSGLKAHVFSIIGPFSMWCAVQAWFAVSIWVDHPNQEPPLWK